VPLALYVVLALLRPGALGDLARPWGRRLIDGDWVAVASTALIPVLAVALRRYSLHRAAEQPSAGQEPGRGTAESPPRKRGPASVA
jgi:hypothetical protein